MIKKINIVERVFYFSDLKTNLAIKLSFHPKQFPKRNYKKIVFFFFTKAKTKEGGIKQYI